MLPGPYLAAPAVLHRVEQVQAVSLLVGEDHIIVAILGEQRSSLVRILPKWTLGDVTLNLLFASDRLLSRAVRAVIDAIMATVPEQARKAVKGLQK